MSELISITEDMIPEYTDPPAQLSASLLALLLRAYQLKRSVISDIELGSLDLTLLRYAYAEKCGKRFFMHYTARVEDVARHLEDATFTVTLSVEEKCSVQS